MFASPEFVKLARHPSTPNAFSRQRSLPLPALVAALVSQRAGSQQASLDAFFGALNDTSALVRQVSDRAFAKARARLHMPALQWLNQHLVRAAEPLGFVPRWHGLRLVAADASVLRPALRPCHRTASNADADQRLFALFLPGAELTLWANVHSAKESALQYSTRPDRPAHERGLAAEADGRLTGTTACL